MKGDVHLCLRLYTMDFSTLPIGAWSLLWAQVSSDYWSCDIRRVAWVAYLERENQDPDSPIFVLIFDSSLEKWENRDFMDFISCQKSKQKRENRDFTDFMSCQKSKQRIPILPFSSELSKIKTKMGESGFWFSLSKQGTQATLLMSHDQ